MSSQDVNSGCSSSLVDVARPRLPPRSGPEQSRQDRAAGSKQASAPPPPVLKQPVQ